MQLRYHMVTIEDLMPAGHFLRKLEAALRAFRLPKSIRPLQIGITPRRKARPLSTLAMVDLRCNCIGVGVTQRAC